MESAYDIQVYCDSIYVLSNIAISLFYYNLKKIYWYEIMILFGIELKKREWKKDSAFLKQL